MIGENFALMKPQQSNCLGSHVWSYIRDALCVYVCLFIDPYRYIVFLNTSELNLVMCWAGK